MDVKVRLNAEDVSKAAAEARKKSKFLQPVVRNKELTLETNSSLGEVTPNGVVVASSPEKFDSPDIHPLRVSSSGVEDATHLVGHLLSGMTLQKDIPLSITQ
ncbi:hypothetical protein HAX54_033297 [Datura stramonium]|uniref:Uncharacterized protein n=1 Tax=Datura stramonium TaxID=4076 RepID=A0ABS8SDF5_DATST|nr:hypothetical protein [Datura stramonium]